MNMDDKQKQIEEMAKEMCKEYGTYTCKNECQLCGDCANEYIAENLIAAGYRKQSDTAREILQYLYEKMGNVSLSDTELVLYLAEQYGVEVEE